MLNNWTHSLRWEQGTRDEGRGTRDL